jgi:hypothetical protein
MSEQKGALVIEITGENDLAAAGLVNLANPEGAAVIITKATLYVETPSTGAANVNVGIGATGANTTTLINALAMNGVISGKAYNGLNPAAKAENEVWAADEFLNVTGSADTTGLVAKLYLEYLRV